MLRWLGAGAAVAVAGVGGVAAYEGYSRGIILRSGEGPDRHFPDRRVTVPNSAPQLVIARGAEPATNVAAALDRMGGLGLFIERGDVVLVKPNAGFGRTPVQAANTSPAVLAAVIRACREAGAAEVIVAECPAYPAAIAFSRSGLRAAAQQAGATFIAPTDSTYVNVMLPGFGRWPVLEPFATATKVINVPAAKHHSRARVTAGMKNWFGILGGQRGELHDRIDDAIVELAALMRPTLTIVDATRLLMRNGPSGGNLADVKAGDAIAVSQDPVAADAWAAAQLEADRDKLAWLHKAAARGLGVADYEALSPVEVTTG
ncbi:MAG: DUF362 domain-containing protein [Deltaproteobacteria bacterium]|nr:DUF362 domain-containing protein [Deltaproteobacteria bacterium]